MKPDLLDAATFMAELGLSRTTVWRMEKRGELIFVRVGRRRFLTAAGLADFNRRLLAGEFASQSRRCLPC